MRDIEAVWGLRFLVRRVEGKAPRRRAVAVKELDEEGSEDSEDDEDEEQEEEDEPESDGPLRHDLILSCRGVGVRGARKAT